MATVLITEQLCLKDPKKRCHDPSEPLHVPPHPVCGSDGRTYFHEREINDHECLTGEEVTVEHEGVCKRYCGYIRPLHRDVCGSDGITYKNEDALHHRNCLDAYSSNSWEKSPIIVAYLGRCKRKCRIADTVLRRVCGSDGRWHLNKDAIDAHNCARKLKGKKKVTVAKDQSLCLASCTFYEESLEEDYGPRCGSDGKTYFLESEIMKYNCREGLKGKDKVKVLYSGYCKTDCPNAPNYWNPVCADDGRNYENEFVLKEMNCINMERIPDFVPAEVSYSSRCTEHCPAISSKYKPVCGTDRMTYKHKSALKHYNCVNKVFGKPPVEIAYKGECYDDIDD